MLRANLDIMSLDQNGENFEFCDYFYNTGGMIEDEFKEFVLQNSKLMAEESCYDVDEPVDFVAVTGISFEEVPDEDVFEYGGK